eukprot:TRINITY_DN7319_c0_g1_i2.p1 TRINITY_DN7319_c0_g1~~TRINITY_DN7319_c0_g1_i2.p1  ORF type:complete len:136 (-),score=36.87 TRINITY_DN7319_c0_g1_i2:48-455(-)
MQTFETLAVVALLHMALNAHDQITPAFWAHSIGATLGIWLVPAVFCELHLGLVAAVCARRSLAALAGTPAADEVRLSGLLAAAGFAAWAVDFFFCEARGGIELHAYAWHFLTAAALHRAGLAAVAITAPTSDKLK